MLTAIKETLKLQEECPACHVNWKEIEASLHEGIMSENYLIAQIIIHNCRVC